MLELRLSYTNVSTKKGSCKRGSVGPGGPRSFEMIFALLAEVVAVHMRYTIIYIQHLGFKGLFALYARLAKSLVRFQVSLHKSFDQFIGRRWSGSRGRSGGRSRSPEDSQGRSGSIAAFGRGSLWTSCKLILIFWRRVTVKAAASARSGYSLVKRWELFLPNGLANPLGLELLEL